MYPFLSFSPAGRNSNNLKPYLGVMVVVLVANGPIFLQPLLVVHFNNSNITFTIIGNLLFEEEEKSSHFDNKLKLFKKILKFRLLIHICYVLFNRKDNKLSPQSLVQITILIAIILHIAR